MRRHLPPVMVAALALLGGCAGYYPPQSLPVGPQGLVRCESQDETLRRCPADVRGGVRLSRQLSRTDCVLGRNWGYDAGGIWVNGGCRAEFAVGGYGGAYGRGDDYGNAGARQVIRCESRDGREQHCAASLRGAALQRQVSRAPCVQGRTWHWDRGGIWVKGGCRGDFAVW